MRKLLLLGLVVLLVVGCTAVGYAKAEKLVLDGSDPDVAIEGASGWAIVNLADDTKTIIEIQVRNLDPNITYYVFSNGLRGEFITNKKGHGHFHFTLPLEEEFSGWIVILTQDTFDPTKRVLYRVT